jgi:hypothetical protein
MHTVKITFNNDIFPTEVVIERDIEENVMNVTVQLAEQWSETESLGSAALHKLSVLASDYRCVWSTGDTKIGKKKLECLEMD